MARRSTAEISEAPEQNLHPKSSEILISHEEAEQHILGLFNAGKLPHAILLTGPRGIGKATFAYRVARFLLAPHEGGGLFGEPTKPESLHISSNHPTFRRMVAGSHPDLMVLEGDEIKIDESRKVGEFLSLTPAESTWRVVVIDSAEAMNNKAANALLKTLEEPPAQAVLILVSHNPGNLLPTIRSRCRILRMTPLSEKDFGAILAMTAPEVSPADYPLWSLVSSGAPGVALSLIEGKANVIYQELLELTCEPDALKQHAFADRYARRDNDAGWKVLGRLIPWLFLRITTQAILHREVFDGEKAMLEQLYRAKPLDLWTELWEKSAKLISDTAHLHLDRKQTILTLLRAAAE